MELVRERPADQQVPSIPANEAVSALGAIREDVLVRTAAELVASAAAHDVVVALVALQDIFLVAADEAVVALPAGDDLPRVTGIAAGGLDDLVIAAVDADEGELRGVHEDVVCAVPGIDHDLLLEGLLVVLNDAEDHRAIGVGVQVVHRVEQGRRERLASALVALDHDVLGIALVVVRHVDLDQGRLGPGEGVEEGRVDRHDRAVRLRHRDVRRGLAADVVFREEGVLGQRLRLRPEEVVEVGDQLEGEFGASSVHQLAAERGAVSLELGRPQLLLVVGEAKLDVRGRSAGDIDTGLDDVRGDRDPGLGAEVDDGVVSAPRVL